LHTGVDDGFVENVVVVLIDVACSEPLEPEEHLPDEKAACEQCMSQVPALSTHSDAVLVEFLMVLLLGVVCLDECAATVFLGPSGCCPQQSVTEEWLRPVALIPQPDPEDEPPF